MLKFCDTCEIYYTGDTVIFFVFDRFTTTNWSTENLYIFRIKSCFQKVVEALKILSDERDRIAVQKEQCTFFILSEYRNTGGTFKLLIRELEVLIKKIMRLESQQLIISDRHESEGQTFL